MGALKIDASAFASAKLWGGVQLASGYFLPCSYGRIACLYCPVGSYFSENLSSSMGECYSSLISAPHQEHSDSLASYLDCGASLG
ncbi:unnamed protein product [Amoebophrya sp. A25]|nr:unnamed protein product [Amoebophrya sp. A25]|eukprot:GSA25T00014406001.1